MPQGLKAARDVYKKKNSVPGVGVGGGFGGGTQATVSSQGAGRGQKHENPNKAKQAKHSGSQKLNLFGGGGGGSQNYGGNQNSWGLRRSEASVWLSLINKLSKKFLLPVFKLPIFLLLFL